METTTIISQFRTKGLTFTNGRHHYYGDLVINNDADIWDNVVIHGDLVVAGNLTSHGRIICLGNIQVGGDFTAARNIIANNIAVGGRFGCYANVRIKSLKVGSYFWVDGNLHVMGNVSAQDTSTVHGWMKANAVDGDVLVDKQKENLLKAFCNHSEKNKKFFLI